MRRLSFNGLVSLGLLLSLHATAAVTDITRIYQQVPTLNGFDICTGGGCAEIKQVSLNDEAWEKIATIFTDTGTASDAKQERKLIAEAIGELEKIVGEKTGTTTDRAGTFGNSNYPGQLDCNDEAINSTTYMRLMRQNGLIRLHEVEDMRTRHFFFSGWPHSTAVIHEIKTGDRYAVDSWFYDNGFSATIVPFAVWKSGYIPQDSPVTKGRSMATDTPVVRKDITAE